MGSICRRKNRYWIKYYDCETDKLVRRSAGSTRLEALTMLRRLIAKEKKGSAAAEEVLFELVWNDYFANLRM